MSDTPTPSWFDIDWHQHAADFGAERFVSDSAVIGDRIVVIGSDEDEPDIWWEDGDLLWRRAEVPAGTTNAFLSDIATVGPTMVVVGSDDDGERGLLWVSSDGKKWQAVDAPVLDGNLWNATSYSDGASLGVADGGLVLLGRNGEADGESIAFVSTDGREWRLASDATQDVADAYAIAGSGGQLTAFDKALGPDDGMTGGVNRVGPIRVWRATGPDSWMIVGELPDSTDAWVSVAAVGAPGWVAIGRSTAGDIAWFSSDGVSWRRAQTPPAPLLWADDAGSLQAFATPVGFVAIGSFFVDECGVIDGGDLQTLTWTSSDGALWRLVDIVHYTDLTSLRRRGSTLIGIGMYAGLAASGVVWTATLPDETTLDQPLPTPMPLPSPTECAG